MNSLFPEGAGFGGSPDAAASAVNFLKALSHEGRLQILCLLLDRELSVSELATALGQHQSAVSQQLMRLRSEGFVAAKRRGKTVIYQLHRQDVKPVIFALREAFCPDLHTPPDASEPTG